MRAREPTISIAEQEYIVTLDTSAKEPTINWSSMHLESRHFASWCPLSQKRVAIPSTRLLPLGDLAMGPSLGEFACHGAARPLGARVTPQASRSLRRSSPVWQKTPRRLSSREDSRSRTAWPVFGVAERGVSWDVGWRESFDTCLL